MGGDEHDEHDENVGEFLGEFPGRNNGRCTATYPIELGFARGPTFGRDPVWAVVPRVVGSPLRISKLGGDSPFA